MLAVVAMFAIAAPAWADPWKHRGGPPWAVYDDYPTVIVVQPTVPDEVVVELPPPPPGARYGQPYRDDDGRYCREYQTTAKIEGRRQRLYGTTCLQPDGSWRFEDGD
jgi:hypothetical protein